MSHVLTIAARDLRERMFVFLTAAIVATMPFWTLFFHDIGDRSTVVLACGVVASAGVSFAVALVVGASMIGRDLAERRMSFYFSKPVSAAAIWFGKLIAAIATIAVTFAIIFVPSYAAAHASWSNVLAGDPAEFVKFALFVATALLLVAHAVSTMIRSRSALIAADVVLLTLGALALWRIAMPLIANAAFGTVLTVQRIVLVAIPLAIASGGVWQLSRGRIDIRRNHAELSRFFWAVMGVVVLAAAVYVAWVLAVTPRELANRYAVTSPRGDWAVIFGDAYQRGGSDFRPAFLVNARNGEWTRIDALRSRRPNFARDGGAVIVARPVISGLHLAPRGELVVDRLDGVPRSQETGISVPLWRSPAILSDDLRRIAVLENTVISVYDLQSHALLGSARLPAINDLRMFFATPDVVRIYTMEFSEPGRSAPQDLAIYEFHVSTRQLTRTGFVPTHSVWLTLSASADGSTIAIARKGTVADKSVILADGRTGAVRTTLPTTNFAWETTLLSNGWVAFVDPTNRRYVLRIFDAAGRLIRDVPTDPVAKISELVPGRKLLVTAYQPKLPRLHGRFDLGVIDIATGTIERAERNVRDSQEMNAPLDPRIPNVHPSELLITDSTGALCRWNPLTGAKTKLF